MSPQRTAVKRQAWLGALAVSVLLHIGLMRTFAPVAQRGDHPAVESVSFELIAAPLAEPPRPAPAQAPTTAEASAPGTTSARVDRTLHAESQRPERHLPSTPSAADAVVPETLAMPVSAPSTIGPAASALLAGGVDAAQVDTPPPSIAPRDAARTVVRLPTRDQQTIEAGAALSGYLQAFASARPHLDRRAPPVLKPLPDGGYAYAGPSFAARVRRDGSVQFIDRVVHPAGSFSFPNDPEKLGVLFTPFHFDLTDAMLSAMGEQLYPAEKRWFLEQTQALREQLEADDRLQLFARARRQLRDALVAIVNDAQRTSHQKRDAVFALWADCADDEVGARGRHVIEEFVREHFAANTPNAFTAGELHRFNQRNAHHRFDPYAPSKPSPGP